MLIIMAANLMDLEDEESHGMGNKILPLIFPHDLHQTITFEQRRVEEKKMRAPISLSDGLGLKDFLSPEVWRASVSELLGTATLVFLIETIIISSYETDIAAQKLVMALLITITVTLIILATFPVSGGHINPIVSLSAALVGVISLSRAAIYILAQCMGGILGTLALKAVLNREMERIYSLGGCTIVRPSPDGAIIIGLGTNQAIWLEIICSFVFLFASRWISLDPRQVKALGRLTVTATVGISAGLNSFVSTTITATEGYTGAGVNPARCFGPAIVRGGLLWDGHWVFWAGPAIGSFTFYLYTKIIPEPHFRPEDFKHDFFNIIRSAFVEPDE